jgi:hypothetical protein
MRVVAIMVLFACGHGDRDRIEETKPMTPPPADASASCADQLRAIVVDGNLASGRGIAGECTRGDAERAFGGTPEPGQGTLSNENRPWLKFKLGEETVARVWLDGDRVILVDVAHPTVREAAAALVARLGEPATKLQARDNPTHKDYVYPDRGLTITVGGQYETPPDLRVTYLFVYAPTTLDDYIGRLGGKDEWVRRFPIRR